MVTPAAKREAVAHLRILFEVSERRACKVLEADRTSVRYRGQRADDAMVRARLRELAAIRRRFGYRRLLVLMRREGLIMNHKKFRRLYREERLQVRRRGGRKRALGTRAPLTIPQGASAGALTSCRMPSNRSDCFTAFAGDRHGLFSAGSNSTNVRFHNRREGLGRDSSQLTNSVCLLTNHTLEQIPHFSSIGKIRPSGSPKVRDGFL